MMKHIQQLIVVEGKNDTARLKQFFDCDTIETGGSRVDKSTLDRIEAAAATRGVIVFTDPDSPASSFGAASENDTSPAFPMCLLKRKSQNRQKGRRGACFQKRSGRGFVPCGGL